MSTTGITSNAGPLRNPRDFKAVEASLPDWDTSTSFKWTKTKNPNWKLGDGASNKNFTNTSISIDPHSKDRTSLENYRLITSAVIPRPTAVVSTVSKDGKSTNLAPYSFFQAMCTDPPIFVVGHAMGPEGAKDSLKNLTETGECVINILTEDILEAANACAVDVPHGVSEWALTGLTPAESADVKPSRIREAVFAVECKLVDVKEFESRTRPGKVSSTMTTVEGVRFWVREDVIDEERGSIDPRLANPIGRLAGISYGRVTDGFKIPWPVWDVEKEGAEANGLLREKVDPQ